MAEDVVRLQGEAVLYSLLASQATPFVCPLDEASVWVAPEGALRGLVRLQARKMSGGAGQTSSGSDFGEPLRAVQGGRARRDSCPFPPAPPPCPAPRTPTPLCTPPAPNPSRCHPSGFGWRDARADFEASMAREHRTERLVGRGSPVAEERRLLQRLLLARLEPWPLKTRAGGNALFEALSIALWATPAYHPLLRQVRCRTTRSRCWRRRPGPTGACLQGCVLWGGCVFRPAHP